MKIGFDAHVLDGRFQGSRTVVTRLAQSLALDEDLQVALYCHNELNLPGPLGRRQIPMSGSFKRLASILPKMVSEDGLDALIYQYICAPWSKNSWVVIHDILPITHPKLFSPRFVLRSAVLFTLTMLWSKRVLVVSDYTARNVARIFPFLKDKVVVVKNGPSFPEETYFAQHDRDVSLAKNTIGPRYILTVGRLEHRKNVSLLVEAYRLAGLTDVSLVVVGKAEPGQPPLPDLPGVIHVQDADDARLVQLYAGASLFVYPSAAEGFGLPLLDAALFGIPTLSSNLTAMPEIGGDLAEYFDPSAPGAAETLGARIRDHFADRPVKTPTLKARQDHAEAFSWKRSGAVLAEALRKSRR